MIRPLLLSCWAALALAAEPGIVGMYVHQHWPYNHPYAARTWTLEDWRGYAGALKKVGYNTIMIWPVIETMPDPPTSSDLAALEKHRQVIAMLHHDHGMRVWIALCPNVAPNDAEARKYAFEKRHFFYCDRRLNPADPAALRELIRRRDKLLAPLAEADAFSIIDSDPGGYPGSTNAEFVELLVEHRKLFDRLRPGIELVYWLHAGWEAYCRYYRTGEFRLGTHEEHLDALARLKKADPAPWGVANGLKEAEELGISGRVISFNYGRIEGEPSFPLTNFGGESAYQGGKTPGPRGLMGNAQTHAVQLPNTFAFARGATRQSLTEQDYVKFAEDLLPGQGRRIVAAWRALSGSDRGAMRAEARGLEEVIASRRMTPGPLAGLLFGSPERFLTDLVLELKLRTAWLDFAEAMRQPELHRFVLAAAEWQRRHGYQNNWSWPGLEETLRKLGSPEVNAVLDGRKIETHSFEDVNRFFRSQETFTTRLLDAMKTADRP